MRKFEIELGDLSSNRFFLKKNTRNKALESLLEESQFSKEEALFFVFYLMSKVLKLSIKKQFLSFFQGNLQDLKSKAGIYLSKYDNSEKNFAHIIPKSSKILKDKGKKNNNGCYISKEFHDKFINKIYPNLEPHLVFKEVAERLLAKSGGGELEVFLADLIKQMNDLKMKEIYLNDLLRKDFV